MALRISERAKPVAWQIRDAEHGKVFSFHSWDAMVLWVRSQDKTWREQELAEMRGDLKRDAP